jgi:hypothetical protein
MCTWISALADKRRATAQCNGTPAVLLKPGRSVLKPRIASSDSQSVAKQLTHAKQLCIMSATHPAFFMGRAELLGCVLQ